MSWVTPGSGSSQPSGRKFYSSGGGGSSLSPLYQPTGAGNAGSGSTDATDAQPGVVTINPLDPGGSASQGADVIGDLFKNLKFGLFGLDTPDANNQRGGLLGDIPLVGDIGRGASNVIGGAADIVGGALKEAQIAERIPSFGGPGEGAMLAQEFAKVPADFVKQFEQKYGHARDTGLLGTGLFANEADFQAQAVRAYKEDQQFENPDLFAGVHSPSGSFMGDLQNLLGLFSAPGYIQERLAAGTQKAQGNRLEESQKLVAAGQGTIIEQIAVEKVANGTWDENQALDFLSRQGAGYSHDPVQNIAAEALLDPMNWLSFGAAGLAKAGVKGAELIATAGRAAENLTRAEKALDAAKAAAKVAKGLDGLEAADKVAAAANDLTKAREAVEALKTARGGARMPILPGTLDSKVLYRAGGMYNAIADTALGKVFKTARYLIDPLHAIDLHMPGAARLVDLASDAQAKTVTQVIGRHNVTPIFEDIAKIDRSGATNDLLSRDIATATANMAREGIMTMRQAAELVKDGGKSIMAAGDAALPETVFNEAVKATKNRDLQRWLKLATVKNVIQRNWTDDALELMSRQLESTYGVRNAAEWLAYLKKASIEQRSYLKLAIYGNSNRRLLEAISHSAGHASAEGVATAIGKRSLNDLVLLARSTPTRIKVDAILSQLDSAVTIEEKARIIRDAVEKYPALNYIMIDDANLSETVSNFTKWLKDSRERFPMQVTHDELQTLHPEMQDLQGFLGEGYSLGFKPEDRFLWGLERTNEAQGGFGVVSNPFIGHVADGGLGFQPGRAAKLNLVGNPIVDVPLKVAAGAVDRMTAAADVLKAQISGAQIAEVARQRFVSEASRGKYASQGLTEAVADTWWRRVHEFVTEQQGYSGPRGLADGNLWNAIKEKRLVPQALLNGSMQMTERDVMQMFLNAYDGDIRYIGLTQKLTGRAKAFLHEKTGSNFLGQVSEHIWPLMKFRYNPIFQLQEKIEPWVLNAQRGVSWATGRQMNAADRATESLLNKLTNLSVIRQADLDQAEYAAQMLHGKTLAQMADSPTTRLGKMNAMREAIMDVQGQKRINMLRTFRHGLGNEIKSSWEKSHPGVWDEMKLSANARAGKLLSDDEFALQLMGENLLANDIVINRLGAVAKQLDDWDNAIKPGQWYVPTDLGKLQPLDLEHVAKAAKLPDADGKTITDLNGLRAYIAEKPGRLNEVSTFLRGMNADPDYIARVENALTFSWTGFWKTAEEKFALSAADSTALQNMIAEAADIRGMTPVDFLSQVFDPMIADKADGALGSLARAKDLRATLGAVKGTSTREDLVRQIANVFADYLDPSLKRKLLIEFKPELQAQLRAGKIRMTPKEIREAFQMDGVNELANRIIGYMDGKAPAGAHDLIEDPARGSKAIREGAEAYMRKLGAEPLPERRNFKLDEDVQRHYDETAKAYGALKETPYERSGRVPRFDGVNKATTKLKDKPAGVDDATYEAYEAFMVDTRQQWDHMIAPKSKGGMGIRVTVSKTDPYTPDAAGRAAMIRDIEAGRLKVYGAESDHPLLTNEQNVMFRAVHDVFGHGGNGYEFGPRGELNAAASHARMYSNEGRPALLTETHGQTAYNNFSEDIIPGQGKTVVIDPSDPIKSYEDQHPWDTGVRGPDEPASEGPRSVKMEVGAGSDAQGRPKTGVKRFTYQSRIGDGIRSLPVEQQHEILQKAADIQAQQPFVKFAHIDVPANFHEPHPKGFGAGPTTDAVTYGSDLDEPVLLFSPRMYGEGYGTFEAERAQAEAVIQANNNFKYAIGESPFPAGTPGNLAITRSSIMTHEAGHAIDVVMRPPVRGGGANDLVRTPTFAKYYDLMEEFQNTWARMHLSMYASRNKRELAGELFTVAFPEYSGIDMSKVPAEVQAYAKRMRDIMEETGMYVPPKPSSGLTVRAANAAKRGTYYAPQKVGLLPQNLLDEFGTKFVGAGKHVESNADVARTAQAFGQWAGKVLGNGLMKDGNVSGDVARLLEQVRGIPQDAAAYHDFTEGTLMQLATATMADRWRDAFRLQYFQQERSMLERSINHPMFGLYPASYMFGKLGPEMVRFLAQRPFGLRTGGLAYSLMDVQAGVAMQREFDPEFDKAIEDAGHSQALSFLGYLLPTLPWEITASAPVWMKDIAAQGSRMEQSGVAEPFNALKPAVDTIKKLNPLETTLPWFARAVGEVQGADKQDTNAVTTVHATTGAELGTPLARAMQELRQALGK